LPKDSRAFDVEGILDRLRTAWGSSDFGYRMQAVFAHVLLRLGGQILEVNAQGHPDVKAKMAGQQMHFQVKTVSHSHPNFQFCLSAKDLAGISPGYRDYGFLAVLDCAAPVDWLLVPEGRARLLVERPTLIATLRAEKIDPFSAECSEAFWDLVLAEQERLLHLSFSLLAQRALHGEPL
jgi:hypothetical protein